MITITRRSYILIKAWLPSLIFSPSYISHYTLSKSSKCFSTAYISPMFTLYNGTQVNCFTIKRTFATELRSDISQGQVDYSVFWSIKLPNANNTSKELPIDPDLPASQIPPIPSKHEPQKPKNGDTKPTLWQRAKKEVLHYYHGFRLLGLEVKIASGMCFRVFLGHTLTRRERKQLVRTVADIIRLLPFAVFIIVPFMEFLLPLYLRFFPFMLPSTFKDKSAEANKLQQTLKAKIEMTRFLQDALNQTAIVSKTDASAPTVAEFQAFIKQLQQSGQPAEPKDITRFSKLFEDQVTLESLDNKQLRRLCRLLSLPAIGPSNLLRFQIWMRVRQLKAEDLLLTKEGVDNIPPFELQSLCQDRGMRSFGLSEKRLRSQLSQWLTLHLENNVPITLLLFSRSLHITQTDTTDLSLMEAIAQLPASATEEAAARVLESTPHSQLDPKLKLEVLRKEQANIKAVRAQRKQELAEQQKAAAATAAPISGISIVDQAATLKGLSDEDITKYVEVEPSKDTIKPTDQPLTDPPRIEASPTRPVIVEKGAQLTTNEKKDDDTEISVGDLAEIKTAIESSSNVLEEEAIHGLKEEVAETAKVRQKRQAALVAAKLPELHTSKAATLLEKRVDRMIQEMGSMINKLGDERRQLLKDIEVREVHIRHSTEPIEKTEMLDAIKADHDKVVDINDLMLSLKRIQKVPNDTKWQKILKVLDEDLDGKIELKHVLSVIELLGSENVKLSSKEIKRVLETIDNEQLANVINKDSVSDSDQSATSSIQSTDKTSNKDNIQSKSPTDMQ